MNPKLQQYRAEKEERVARFWETIYENQKARAARTDEQQLELIKKRRGESKKERARLEARINECSRHSKV